MTAVDQLRSFEATCVTCANIIRTSLDARPTSQIHLDNASLKLRDYMDALESMKVPMRAPDLSQDDAEYWKQRRAALKAEHEKFAGEFELREKHEGKEAVELTEEDRRLMSGRAPPPVVQNRLLELAAQPKTPVQEQRTFEPAPLKQPTHQKKASRVPAAALNDTPEPDGRSQPEPPPRSQSNNNGSNNHTNNTASHASTGGTGGAAANNGSTGGHDTNKVAPADGSSSKDPMNQPAASGCCIIL